MPAAPRAAAIGIRTKPEIRDALARIAADKERSISWLVERIIVEWLEANDTGAVPVRDRKQRPGRPG